MAKTYLEMETLEALSKKWDELRDGLTSAEAMQYVDLLREKIDSLERQLVAVQEDRRNLAEHLAVATRLLAKGE